MPRLSLKKQMVFTLTLVCCVLLVVTGFVVFPRVKSILEIRNTILTRQIEVERQHSQSRKLRLTLLELDRSLLVAKDISQATVSSGQELPIIRQLESLSDVYGIDQNLSVAVKDVPKDDPLFNQGIKVYYELTFLNHGTYEQLLSYLHAIEGLPYYMSIDELHWERNSARSSEEIVTLRFTGDVYIYAQ